MMSVREALALGGLVSFVVAGLLVCLAIWVYVHDDIGAVRADLAGRRRLATQDKARVPATKKMDSVPMREAEQQTVVDDARTEVAAVDEAPMPCEIVYERILCGVQAAAVGAGGAQ